MRLRRVIRSVFVGCVCALSVAAQNWISVGVKGGVPLTDPIASRTYNLVIASIPNPFGPPNILSQQTAISSGSRRLVLGPTLEVQLPFGLAVEADALYRPMSVKVQSTNYVANLVLNAPVFTGRIDAWEFPFLAKYRLPLPVMKPYIEAGPNFRAISASLAQHMAARGFSAGIGVESRIGFLRIAPEVRYTHWGGDGNGTTLYHASSYPNQVEFLAGLATAPADSGTSLTGKEWRRHISLGVKGGMPFTGAFLADEFGKVSYPSVGCQWFTSCTAVTGTVQTYTASRNYLVGPLVEVHLPLDLSIEADALYHPVSLAAPPDLRLPQLPSIKTFSSWEFPIVGKYKFRAPFARPYLEAGPTFRAGSSQYHHYLASAGATAGVGIEAIAWRVHIAPEVRFVHWGHDAPDAGPFYSSKRNQAQFLLGLSY